MGSPERRSSETGAVEPEVPPCCSSSLFPELSVLMPVRNALPWLCDAVGSVLAQRGVRLELIAVDDGSTDGSLAWLRACASALAARPGRGTTAYDRVVEEAAVLPWEAHAAPTLDPTEVAARAQPGASLRVLSVAAPRGLSGQGLALNTALCASTAQLVGEMEADDLRPPHAFAALRDALAAHPGWGGATSRVALAGWPRPGMQRWVDWQNGVGCGPGGAAELAFNRFVEIPAMRAAGLYRRKALLSLGSRPYRDLWALPCGTLVDAAAGEEGEADWEWSGGDTVATAPLPDCVASAPLPGWWPVDTDFFGRWFDRGLVMGKLPEALYVWRQYPSQSTRTHSRCAQERLRAAKAHFLAAVGGPCARAASASACGAHVQLWGCGRTLDLWATALEGQGVAVLPVRWRPGEAPPPAVARPAPGCVARLWAFGMERARARVRASAPGGFSDEGFDVWIA